MSDCDVLVLGGGPAGSTAAAAASRAGQRVVLLEAGQHPRAHVGESLLPGIIPILQDIGALESIEAAGFARKTGSTLWNWGRTPRWDLWFSDSDAFDAAWFVDRATFDALLFSHAEHCGAQVHQHANVREVFEVNGRVTGARWLDRNGRTREVSARVVIDATGQSGLVVRPRSERSLIEGLQHQALWAHFENARHLPAPREQQALFVAQPSQWFWMFPLANGRASVGVVQLDTDRARSAPRPDLDALVRGCPELAAALGPEATRSTAVRAERDWSYRATTPAGPGWYAVGDAAGFIDPVLSTGVMLALHSGWLAAQCAYDELSGVASGSDARARYLARHGEMFDDLLAMVRFYYRQNADRDDYFWASKSILADTGARLKPQKAFVLLTSGLVSNLALNAQHEARAQTIEAAATHEPPPTALDFIGVHLRVHDRDELQASTEGGVPVRGSSLFLLVEPPSASTPTLFRTCSTHINAIAPRHGNDPISVPLLADTIRSFRDLVVDHDRAQDSLAALWQRLREPLAAWVERLAPPFEFVRAFGDHAGQDPPVRREDSVRGTSATSSPPHEEP